jgi:hypothetical protein
MGEASRITSESAIVSFFTWLKTAVIPNKKTEKGKQKDYF